MPNRYPGNNSRAPLPAASGGKTIPDAVECIFLYVEPAPGHQVSGFITGKLGKRHLFVAGILYRSCQRNVFSAANLYGIQVICHTSAGIVHAIWCSHFLSAPCACKCSNVCKVLNSKQTLTGLGREQTVPKDRLSGSVICRAETAQNPDKGGIFPQPDVRPWPETS